MPAFSAIPDAPPIAHGPIVNDAPHGLSQARLGDARCGDETVHHRRKTRRRRGEDPSGRPRGVLRKLLAGATAKPTCPCRKTRSSASHRRQKPSTSVAVMMLMERRQARPRRSTRQVPAGVVEDHRRRRRRKRHGLRCRARQARHHHPRPALPHRRHLLRHRPGEKAWKDAGIYGWYFADKNVPVSDVVARMAKLPMAAQPGEQWVYGYNTDILGVLVEKLSGKSLDVFLKERLIDPLGMADTSFACRPRRTIASPWSTRRRMESPSAHLPRRDAGHRSYRPGPLCRRPVQGLRRRRRPLSTAHDYSRFLEMLRQGGTFEGKRYISRNSVDLDVARHAGVSDHTSRDWASGLGFASPRTPA